MDGEEVREPKAADTGEGFREALPKSGGANAGTVASRHCEIMAEVAVASGTASADCVRP